MHEDTTKINVYNKTFSRSTTEICCIQYMRKNALKIPLVSLTNKDINANMMNINMHDVRKISQKEKSDNGGVFSP